MATNNERNELKKAYPSKKWAEKVDKMKDDQVVAIYARLRQQGVIKV